MKLYKVLALLITFFLIVGMARGQSCPPSMINIDQVYFQSNGSLSFSATFIACLSDGFNTTNKAPKLRVRPLQGPPQNVEFTNYTSGLSAQVNSNAATPLNTLRRGQGANNFDIGKLYTDNISFENPNGEFEFQLCLYHRQGNNASPVTCSNVVTYEEPEPSLTAIPDINVSLEPSTTSNATKVFNDVVTVSYDNLSSDEGVQFRIQENLPSGWMIEANVENTGWRNVNSFITYNPNPNGNQSSGTFDIEYRVKVPLYESPQNENLTAEYEVFEVQ